MKKKTNYSMIRNLHYAALKMQTRRCKNNKEYTCFA